MPLRDPDASDPMEIVGVSIAAGPESARDMAYAFAEELARDGYDAGPILAIFESPFYVGAHLAWRSLGEIEIRRIVAECVAVFGRKEL